MTIELATALAELILACAIFLQSLEYLRGLKFERRIGLIRALFSILLMFGIQPVVVEFALLVLGLVLLWRFQGPYNGGSDTMTLLVLLCLWFSHLLPKGYWQEIALGYLAVQLMLSYFQSGWVKLTNSDWRSGRALQEVFAVSAYPVSESSRLWAQRPYLLTIMSWAVILFELLFPLAIFKQSLLLVAMCVAGLFHLANAWLFGLNRFFWIWPAAFPILVWFQARLVAAI